MALFLHFPLKCTCLTEKFPFGTYIVAGFEEPQAESQAVKNAFDESVFPSDFAPKFMTFKSITLLAMDLVKKTEKSEISKNEEKGLLIFMFLDEI